MRAILVGAVLSLLSTPSFAACTCQCVGGQPTSVCSRDPGSLNLPIICQRLCLEPVTTPLAGGGGGGDAVRGPQQQTGVPTATNPALNPMAPR